MINHILQPEQMTPELRAALDDAGFGDLDPITGPENNPKYLDELQRASLFLNHANAYENPWVGTPHVPNAYADPRLDPDSPEYEG